MSLIPLTLDLKACIEDGRNALNGDSNDAEHDALFSLVEELERLQKPNGFPNGPDSWAIQSILFGGSGRCMFGRVIITPFTVVVMDRFPKKDLKRGVEKDADWHIDPDVKGCYIDRFNGVYVLPRNAVTRLSGADYLKFV